MYGSRIPFQRRDSLSRYRVSHYKDETIVWPWYPYYGNSYASKLLSVYCNALLDSLIVLSSTSGVFYTPRFNEVERGVYWFHLVRPSVCPSVRLSVCGQNRVCSVSSTILIGSISYLHILSSNFRRCVACNVCLKNWNLAEFFKFVTLTLSSDLGSNMTQ